MRKEMKAAAHQLIASVMLSVSLEAVAEEPQPIAIELSETRPTAIENTSPRYPQWAALDRQEGWVALRFTVQADGTTTDVEVVERVGPDRFDRVAIDWALEQRFKPALSDGKPIDARVGSRVILALEGFENTVTPAYRRIARLAIRNLNSGELDEAWKHIEILDEQRQQTLAEGGYLDYLKTLYFEQTGDIDQALKHVNRALIARDYAFDAASREELYRLAVSVRAHAMQLAASLDSYADLEALVGATAPDDPIARLSTRIRQIVDGDSVLVVDGTLSGCERCSTADTGFHWSHMIARQKFRFAEADGPLGAAMVACGNRGATFQVVPEVTYKLPDGAERCFLRLSGDVPTTFRFMELPSATPMAQASP